MEQAVHSVEWQHFTEYTITDLTNNKYNSNKKIWIRYRQTSKALSAWPTGEESGRRRFSKSGVLANKFRSRKMLSVRRPNGECLPFNRELRKRKLTTAPRGGRNWKGITGWTENRDKRKGVPHNEVEITRNNAVASNLKLIRYLLWRTEERSEKCVRIVCLLDKIRTGNLPNSPGSG
jgi:hypothetical protein